MTGHLHMPAEWELHTATWLAWPHNRNTWPQKLLTEVEAIYVRMITSLLDGEKVQLLVPHALMAKKVLRLLPKKAKTNHLFFHPVRYVDSWIRDYGPIFVKITDGKRKGEKGSRVLPSVSPIGHKWIPCGLWSAPPSVTRDPFSPPSCIAENVAFTKWQFNAWGKKYADLAKDNGVVNRMSALKNYKRFDVGMVLEGGSVEVNGAGVCLTTRQCLLNPNRNPKLSKKKIVDYLKNYLGVQKVIWLNQGIEGDDTDGHIDDLARFVDRNTVVTAVEPNRMDPNHGVLKENLNILKRETDGAGRRLRVVELPMPGKIGSNERLPASYANFYIGNRSVLVPSYGHKNDKRAVRVLAKFFPSRKIVPIECTALVHGLGSIHCVTQQEPL